MRAVPAAGWVHVALPWNTLAVPALRSSARVGPVRPDDEVGVAVAVDVPRARHRAAEVVARRAAFEEAVRVRAVPAAGWVHVALPWNTLAMPALVRPPGSAYGAPTTRSSKPSPLTSKWGLKLVSTAVLALVAGTWKSHVGLP